MADIINKYIKVSYKLYAPMQSSGEVELLEETSDNMPFQFISGMGLTLDAFEGQLVNLAKGEKFKFTLSVEEAYGAYVDEAVQRVPRSVFEINGELNSKYVYEGAVVPLQNSEGERFNGTIVEISDKEITVDLNHPLAGKPLTFEGEVLENREATNQEIEQMAKMLSGEGCGGNCGGGCGGNCGDGGCGGCGGCN